MRYEKEGEVHVYNCSPYEKYVRDVWLREDTCQIAGEGDLLGQDDELEWGCLYNNLNAGTDYLLSVSSGRGWVQKDSEVVQPERTGCNCLSSGADPIAQEGEKEVNP